MLAPLDITRNNFVCVSVAFTMAACSAGVNSAMNCRKVRAGRTFDGGSVGTTMFVPSHVHLVQSPYWPESGTAMYFSPKPGGGLDGGASYSTRFSTALVAVFTTA